MKQTTLSQNRIINLKSNNFMEKKFMYGSKIRAVRLMRGLTQEDIADKLKIKQNTYSKIETGQKKVTHEELESIAQILEVSVSDLTSQEPIIFNNVASNKGSQTQNVIDHIEHFYTDQKDMLEKIITSKDDEIKNLKEVIQSLKEVISSLKK
jgi:transcriptional regulator with XRE-family HTH domain